MPVLLWSVANACNWDLCVSSDWGGAGCYLHWGCSYMLSRSMASNLCYTGIAHVYRCLCLYQRACCFDPKLCESTSQVIKLLIYWCWVLEGNWVLTTCQSKWKISWSPCWSWILCPPLHLTSPTGACWRFVPFKCRKTCLQPSNIHTVGLYPVCVLLGVCREIAKDGWVSSVGLVAQFPCA
jgi:hypothetical protein